MAIETRADVKRIIHILAKQYEDDPRVVLRELVQNAADAITTAAKVGDDYLDEIEVEIIDADDRESYNCELAVRDFAMGMNREEFESYLATLGSSSRLDDIDTIGEWGIGFYAIVVICKEAIVVTKKRGEDILAFRYSVERDEYSDLSEAELQWVQQREYIIEGVDSGTCMYLRIDFDRFPDLKDWLNRQRLEVELRTFCQFIPYPVRVKINKSDRGSVVNFPLPPWKRSEGDIARALNELWKQTHLISSPDSFPQISKCFSFGPDDESHLEGVCYYLDGFSGGVRIFYKGMLVEVAQDILPSWALPFSLIVNYKSSRESKYHYSVPPSRTHVVRNDGYFALQSVYHSLVLDTIKESFGKFRTELQSALLSCDVEQRSREFIRVAGDSKVISALNSVGLSRESMCRDLCEILVVVCAEEGCHSFIKQCVIEMIQSQSNVDLDKENLVQALKAYGKATREIGLKERKKQRDTRERPTWHHDESLYFLKEAGDFLPVTAVVKEFPAGRRPVFTSIRVPVNVLPVLDPSVHSDGVTRLPVLMKGDAGEYLLESEGDRLVLVPDKTELIYLSALSSVSGHYRLDVVNVKDTSFQRLSLPEKWEELKRAFEDLVHDKVRDGGDKMAYKIEVAGFEKRDVPIVLHEDSESNRILTINGWNRGMSRLNDLFGRCVESGSTRTEKALRMLIHDLFHSASYRIDVTLDENLMHSLQVKEQTIIEICEVFSEFLDLNTREGVHA